MNRISTLGFRLNNDFETSQHLLPPNYKNTAYSDISQDKLYGLVTRYVEERPAASPLGRNKNTVGAEQTSRKKLVKDGQGFVDAAGKSKNELIKALIEVKDFDQIQILLNEMKENFWQAKDSFGLLRSRKEAEELTFYILHEIAQMNILLGELMQVLGGLLDEKYQAEEAAFSYHQAHVLYGRAMGNLQRFIEKLKVEPIGIEVKRQIEQIIEDKLKELERVREVLCSKRDKLVSNYEWESLFLKLSWGETLKTIDDYSRILFESSNKIKKEKYRVMIIKDKFKETEIQRLLNEEQRAWERENPTASISQREMNLFSLYTQILRRLNIIRGSPEAISIWEQRYLKFFFPKRKKQKLSYLRNVLSKIEVSPEKSEFKQIKALYSKEPHLDGSDFITLIKLLKSTAPDLCGPDLKGLEIWALLAEEFLNWYEQGRWEEFEQGSKELEIDGKGLERELNERIIGYINSVVQGIKQGKIRYVSELIELERELAKRGVYFWRFGHLVDNWGIKEGNLILFDTGHLTDGRPSRLRHGLIKRYLTPLLLAIKPSPKLAWHYRKLAKDRLSWDELNRLWGTEKGRKVVYIGPEQIRKDLLNLITQRLTESRANTEGCSSPLSKRILALFTIFTLLGGTNLNTATMPHKSLQKWLYYIEASSIESVSRQEAAIPQAPDEKQKQADEYFEHALNYMELEMYEKAIEQFTLAINSKSLRPPALMACYLLRGFSFLGLDREKEAELDFKMAKDLAIDDEQKATIEYSIGFTYFSRGRFDAAIGYFKEAVRLSPDDPVFRNDLGRACYQQGKYLEAVVHLDKAIQIDSEYGLAYMNRGLVHFSLRDWAASVKDLKRVLELEPDIMYKGVFIRFKLAMRNYICARIKDKIKECPGFSPERKKQEAIKILKEVKKDVDKLAQLSDIGEILSGLILRLNQVESAEDIEQELQRVLKILKPKDALLSPENHSRSFGSNASASPVDLSHTSSPMQRGRLGWKKIYIPNIKIPKDFIVLRRGESGETKQPRRHKKIKGEYLFYNINFQGRLIKDNYIRLVLSYRYKDITVLRIETRWGRYVIQDEGIKGRRWNSSVQAYPGVGSTVIDFLRQEALRLGWTVSFMAIKDKRGDSLRKLINRYFKDIRVVDSFSGFNGYRNELRPWDGKELNNTVIGIPKNDVELLVSSSPAAENNPDSVSKDLAQGSVSPMAKAISKPKLIKEIIPIIQKRLPARDKISFADLDTGRSGFMFLFGNELNKKFSQVKGIGIETLPEIALVAQEGNFYLGQADPYKKGSYESKGLTDHSLDIVTINNPHPLRYMALVKQAARIVKDDRLILVTIEGADVKDSGALDLAIISEFLNKGFEVEPMVFPSDYPHSPTYHEAPFLLIFFKKQGGGLIFTAASPLTFISRISRGLVIGSRFRKSREQYNLSIIGITGPPGAGKTTVAKFLKNKGYYVIEIDEVIKGVSNNLLRSLLKRAILNIMVFMEMLPDVFIPITNFFYRIIIKKVCKDLRTVSNSNTKHIFVDYAFLSYSGIKRFLDTVCCIYRDKEKREKGYIERKVSEGMPEDEARLKFQELDELSDKENYLKITDVFLENNGRVEELHEKIEELLRSKQLGSSPLELSISYHLSPISKTTASPEAGSPVDSAIGSRLAVFGYRVHRTPYTANQGNASASPVDFVSSQYFDLELRLRHLQKMMPVATCAKENAEWALFKRNFDDIRSLPGIQAALVAPEALKDVVKEADAYYPEEARSSKIESVRFFRTYLWPKFKDINKANELSCLGVGLENVLQHVDNGVAMLYYVQDNFQMRWSKFERGIATMERRRIVVADNGYGFCDYRTNEKVSIQRAMEDGARFEKNSREGLGLGTIAGRYGHITLIEQPQQAAVYQKFLGPLLIEEWENTKAFGTTIIAYIFDGPWFSMPLELLEKMAKEFPEQYRFAIGKHPAASPLSFSPFIHLRGGMGLVRISSSPVKNGNKNDESGMKHCAAKSKRIRLPQKISSHIDVDEAGTRKSFSLREFIKNRDFLNPDKHLPSLRRKVSKNDRVYLCTIEDRSIYAYIGKGYKGKLVEIKQKGFDKKDGCLFAAYLIDTETDRVKEDKPIRMFRIDPTKRNYFITYLPIEERTITKEGEIITRNTELNRSGRLHKGKPPYLRFFQYPEAPVEYKALLVDEEEIILEVRISWKGKPITKRLYTVRDNKTGKLLFSFNNLPRARLKQLKDITIEKQLDGAGGLTILGEKVWGNLPRKLKLGYAWVDVRLEEPEKIIDVTFIEDSQGWPVFNKNGEPFKIIIGKDLKEELSHIIRVCSTKELLESDKILLLTQMLLNPEVAPKIKKHIYSLFISAAKDEKYLDKFQDILGKLEVSDQRQIAQTINLFLETEAGEDLLSTIEATSLRRFAKDEEKVLEAIKAHLSGDMSEEARQIRVRLFTAALKAPQEMNDTIEKIEEREKGKEVIETLRKTHGGEVFFGEIERGLLTMGIRKNTDVVSSPLAEQPPTLHSRLQVEGSSSSPEDNHRAASRPSSSPVRSEGVLRLQAEGPLAFVACSVGCIAYRDSVGLSAKRYPLNTTKESFRFSTSSLVTSRPVNGIRHIFEARNKKFILATAEEIIDGYKIEKVVLFKIGQSKILKDVFSRDNRLSVLLKSENLEFVGGLVYTFMSNRQDETITSDICNLGSLKEYMSPNFFYVRPEYENKKFGRILMAQAISDMKAKGVQLYSYPEGTDVVDHIIDSLLDEGASISKWSSKWSIEGLTEAKAKNLVHSLLMKYGYKVIDSGSAIRTASKLAAASPIIGYLIFDSVSGQVKNAKFLFFDREILSKEAIRRLFIGSLQKFLRLTVAGGREFTGGMLPLTAAALLLLDMEFAYSSRSTYFARSGLVVSKPQLGLLDSGARGNGDVSIIFPVFDLECFRPELLLGNRSAFKTWQYFIRMKNRIFDSLLREPSLAYSEISMFRINEFHVNNHTISIMISQNKFRRFTEKSIFNADSRKSNADKRRFSDEPICDHLRSRRIFQRSLLNSEIKRIRLIIEHLIIQQNKGEQNEGP